MHVMGGFGLQMDYTVRMKLRLTEMYVLMWEKLRISGDSSEEFLLPKDALVISEPDLYYKEESFKL